ncbi:MAG: hypothetical protein K2X50_04650 [Gammaproteobacteria bacterium]|nr:hypothetical protein [Gammaproteobacteria bacterium]
MNIKQLYDQLTKIFPMQDEEMIFIESLDEASRAKLGPSTLTSFQIREIITDATLNNEQKRNHLEAFLINKIKTEGHTEQKNIFKFALKLSLLSRGYFTDDLGQLEKQLLLLPCHDFLNPDIQFLNDPGNIHSLWQNINVIRLELSNCFSKTESYCSKLEKLAKLIRDILYKYQHLNPEPNTEQEKLTSQEKNKTFLLNLIKTALNLINDAMLQTNDNEWSLWTSAALESLDYHKDLKSQSDDNELEQYVHRDRSNYFLTFLKASNDPIYVYVENQLLKYHYMNLSETSESSLDTLPTIEAIKNTETPVETLQKMKVIEDAFSEAYQLLLAANKDADFIKKAIQCAIILENNGSSIGTFIRTAAYVLAEPLSLNQWLRHFETLQCIAIPYRWRTKIFDIWFVLAEFFSKNYSEACVFYKEAEITCKKQINNTNTNVNIVTSVPRYSKQVQYQLSKYLLQIATDDFDKIEQSDLKIIIDDLLNSENPYCFAEIIRILCSNSDLREILTSAIEKKYCREFSDPRIFCEQVLQKTEFNKYLIIWGPLTCSTGLNNRYIPVDVLSAETKISDTIQFKHCTQVRQQLRHVLNDKKETTMVVPCGFSYLKVLEKKLYHFSSRLMPDLTDNTLYDAFNFTHNRKGLRDAVVALLFFYDGNYYAAEKMARLSLKCHSSTNIELKPQHESNPSTLPSVIGTPTHGSPERPRKLSLRLNVIAVKKNNSDSPEISPRPYEQHPHLSNSRSINIPTLKALRDSDHSFPSSSGRTASPQFPLSPGRSPSGSIDIPLPITKSPRAPSFIASKTGGASPLPINLEQNNASPLGHLIKAMILWETRLKNNNKRSRSDVLSFQHELSETQGCSIPDEERNFITGLRWLYYLLSKNPSTQKRDEIWLTDRDKAQYITVKKEVEADDKRMIQINEGQERDLDEYTLFKIARYYLYNKPTSENPNTKKFAPAVLIIFQFLKSYIDKYPNTKPHLIEKDLEDLARSLKNAVFIDGYFPAIPAYLACYSLAHPPVLEASEIMTSGLTPADRVELIKNALTYSEHYTPFPINSTQVMTEQLKIIDMNEEQQLVLTRSYSVENIIAFNHRFDCLPIKISFGDSIISIDLIKQNENCVWQCKLIPDGEDESSFINDLESLQKLFLRAARVYSYCNKVNISYDQIILRQDNCLIITHADIAIIGLIFLVEGKLSIKLTRSDAASLIALLNAAKSLPITSWRWKETHARLQNFAPRIQNSKTDGPAKDLDPDELRSKLIPLSPPQEHGVSPRGHFSPPPSKQRSSLILANPRRASNADLLAHSGPTSPRGLQSSLSKRDSGKVTIPDGSSGSISGNRSRSVTESSLSKKK